jgi:PAS domain S-box-containing protein
MLNSIPLLIQSEPISVVVQPLVVHPDLTVMNAVLQMSSIREIGSLSSATSQLAALQIQVRSSCVAIVEEGRLIGLLTEPDILRFIATQQDLDNLTIREAIDSNLVTLNASAFTDLAVAMNLIQQHQLRYLPVVDDRHCLLGILTHEILQHHLAEALAAAVVRLESEKIALRESCPNDSADLVEDLAKILTGKIALEHAELAPQTAELRESRQFLQTVIETFPLAVFWKDRESRYLGCNYNFAQAANLNFPEQIVGKTDDDLPWGAIEADAYRADDRQVIDSGMTKLGIIETQTQADGTSIWIETNKLPLRNLNGETIGVLGTYQNVTDRQQKETQLHRISERLSLSLKSGAFGCWEWDIIRDCLIWDDRMYELYGATKSADREAYATWVNSLHPDDRIATEEKLAQALLGTAEFDTEFRAIHPDGSIHFIKAYGLVQRDQHDRPHSIIGINFDITATKRDEVIRHRTEATIRQQAEREYVLREITKKIRQSLELAIVFETAVHKIREFMATDRVGIFKFDADLDFDEGEFIAESVGSGFESILGSKIHIPCFAEKLAWYYQRGSISAVEDIYTAGLLDGEIRILEKFQVRANLIVPLMDGTVLWGLLCLQQCSAPRAWQEPFNKLPSMPKSS